MKSKHTVGLRDGSVVLAGAIALCSLMAGERVRAGATEDATAGGTPAAPAATAGELDDVVVTAVIGTYHESTSSMATKIPMDMMDIPSSLSILNSDAIKDRNAVLLSDVFNSVVGAAVSQGTINGFTFRGFSNTGSYTQNIQFDGLQGPTLKKAANTAADVESIEFLKGPNGVLYGQMNPGGLLNIVTKSPLETQRLDIHLSGGVYAGRYGSDAPSTRDFSVDATGPVLGSDHVFYRFVADGASVPAFRPGDRDNTVSVYPSLTYKWSDATSFTIKGEAAKETRRADDGVIPIFTSPVIPVHRGATTTQSAAYGTGASYITAPLNTVYNDRKDSAYDKGAAVATFFNTAVMDWKFRMQTRSVWHEDEVNQWAFANANVYSPAAKYATPGSLLRRQYSNVVNKHLYNYADANVYRVIGPEYFRNTILVGVGGGGETFYNQVNAVGPNATLGQAITLYDPALDQTPYPASGTGFTNPRVWQTAFGQYLSDQIKIGDFLNISLGVRHDMQKVHGLDVTRPALSSFANKIDAITKQAGIVYHIIPSVSLYGSWSQSIKPQTQLAYDVSGSPNFPPQTGEQFEAGFKFEAPSKNLNFTLASYQITRSNVTVATNTFFTVPTGAAPAGVGIFRLDGKQQSRGIEAELQWQPMPNWQIQAGYAFSKAIITQSVTNPYTIGDDLASAPRNSGTFWSRYNIPNGTFTGLGFGMGASYVGPSWAGDPTTPVYYQTPGWVRIDGSAYYKWGRYDVALNIQNLMDRSYITTNNGPIMLYVGNPRLVTLSFGIKL